MAGGNHAIIRVAVVEDTLALGKVIRRVVDSMAGVECVGVWENAEDGLKQITRLKPDVVLMDIILPGMTGIEATAQLKEAYPEMEVIMLTAYDDHDKIFDALKAGASGYLLKSASPEELRLAILNVRAGGAPMSADIARLVVQAFHRPPANRTGEVLKLSKRETEIVELVAKGLANKEIAADLSISVETVRVHLKHIYEKLHVRSRTEAAMKYRDSLERQPWD